MFNRELDSCLDPNRPAVLRDSIELELSIKLMVSRVGFFGFLGNVKDERLRSTPDLLNLAPRCFCFSVAVKIKYMRAFMTSESDVLIINNKLLMIIINHRSKSHIIIHWNYRL